MDPSFRQSVSLSLRSQTPEEYLMYRCQIGECPKRFRSFLVWLQKFSFLLIIISKRKKCFINSSPANSARTYLQLPLRQWGAGNVYLLVLSNWKVNIAENPIAVMGLQIRSGSLWYISWTCLLFLEKCQTVVDLWAKILIEMSVHFWWDS